MTEFHSFHTGCDLFLFCFLLEYKNYAKMSTQKLPKPDLKLRSNRWKSALYAAIFISVACVPIIIKPYFSSSTYQKIQNEMRSQFGKSREELQPGGLRPWSDPFKERTD